MVQSPKGLKKIILFIHSFCGCDKTSSFIEKERFFLWGYLKEKVFKHRPHTLEELKDRIREEIGAYQSKCVKMRQKISEIAFISVSLLAAIIFLMSFLKLNI